MRKRVHWKTREKQEREAAADRGRPMRTASGTMSDDTDFDAFIDGVRALNKVTKTGWLSATRSMLALIDGQSKG